MKTKKYAYGIVVFIIAVLAATSLIGAVFCKENGNFPGIIDDVSMKDGWILEEPSGEETPVTVPFSMGHSGMTRISRELPELDNDSVLRIRCTFETINAYIDGQQVFHAEPTSVFGHPTTLGNYMALIPLSREESHKIITLEIVPRNYAYAVHLKEICVTTMSGFTLQRIRELLPYIVLAAMLMVISFLAIVVAIIMRCTLLSKTAGDSEDEAQLAYRRRLAHSFVRLFYFGIIVSVWMVSEFHVIGIMNNRMTLSGMVNYVSFFLLPVVFSSLLLSIIPGHPFTRVIMLLSMANFILQMLLFLCGVIDLPDGLFVNQILVGLLILNMLIVGITNIYNRETKKFEHPERWILLAGMLIFASLSLIRYGKKGEWMPLVAVAMLFFTLYTIQILMIDLYRLIQYGIKGEQMRVHAYVDDLTGLKNRRAYDEEMNRLLEGGLQDDLIYLMMDVNGLKKANDILGHAAGDELLTGAAQTIQEVFGQFGTCYRTGGDEFVVIAFGSKETLAGLTRIFQEKMEAWRGHFDQTLSISIGGALWEEHLDLSVEELAKLADHNMYLAKKAYYEKKGMDRRRNRTEP